MSIRFITAVTLALSLTAAPVFAQSLADVARAEEARRAQAPKSKKVYSNVDLGPGGVPEPAPESAAAATGGPCYMSKSEGKCVTPEAMVEKSEAVTPTPEPPNAPSETLVRQQADNVRAELTRIQQDLDALAAQAANESLAPAKRQLAQEQLELQRPTLTGLQRRWARLERQIKDFKLPHAWIEPVPDNARPQ